MRATLLVRENKQSATREDGKDGQGHKGAAAGTRQHATWGTHLAQHEALCGGNQAAAEVRDSLPGSTASRRVRTCTHTRADLFFTSTLGIHGHLRHGLAHCPSNLHKKCLASAGDKPTPLPVLGQAAACHGNPQAPPRLKPPARCQGRPINP